MAIEKNGQSFKEYVTKFGSNHYYACTNGDRVIFRSYDQKPILFAIKAMEMIAASARNLGCRTMSTYVDKFDFGKLYLLAYVRFKKAHITWTDGRFVEYEWSISPDEQR